MFSWYKEHRARKRYDEGYLYAAKVILRSDNPEGCIRLMRRSDGHWEHESDKGCVDARESIAQLLGVV